jgi:osmotically-inducible protein OsmY
MGTKRNRFQGKDLWQGLRAGGHRQARAAATDAAPQDPVAIIRAPGNCTRQPRKGKRTDQTLKSCILPTFISSGILGAARAWPVIAVLALVAPQAVAQFNPLSALGKAVSVTLDARSKSEVAADSEISAAISKQLLADKGAEWAGVSALVFQRHVVLAGAVKTKAVRQRVEDLVRREKRVKSLTNEILVGDVASLARDTALEARINVALTSASGVSSVNMRWCATGGHVVLMGLAQSSHEADLAQSKVRGISGVKSLKSYLKLVARKK